MCSHTVISTLCQTQRIYNDPPVLSYQHPTIKSLLNEQILKRTMHHIEDYLQWVISPYGNFACTIPSIQYDTNTICCSFFSSLYLPSTISVSHLFIQTPPYVWPFIFIFIFVFVSNLYEHIVWKCYMLGLLIH